MPIKGFSYIPYDIKTLDVDAISLAMYLSCNKYSRMRRIWTDLCHV
jgi:hypothetical protein